MNCIEMNRKISQSIPILLLKGDGIGPEIVSSAVKVLQASGAPLDFLEMPFGFENLKETGAWMTQDVLEVIIHTRIEFNMEVIF